MYDGYRKITNKKTYLHKLVELLWEKKSCLWGMGVFLNEKHKKRLRENLKKKWSGGYQNEAGYRQHATSSMLLQAVNFSKKIFVWRVCYRRQNERLFFNVEELTDEVKILMKSKTVIFKEDGTWVPLTALTVVSINTVIIIVIEDC